ncbi:MAG: ABC transporter ATP-binding protein, partial [Chloroflexi bacterium]|nr:ABC transporter ATP-binding protein [Chloroflexota bacterium]
GLVPALVTRLVRPSRKDQLHGEEFWALRDVSFEVCRGEALGIIGPNGAGKSTALKLLTRILKPTRGSCTVRGRVGALIEVAAGFHPDLTGRENILLQGAVIGMRREEIAKKFDEIIEFAGVGEFVDTQVKRYSSGMNARLGFSIAAHMDPDVLIIDEVLSVGDMAFQQKCVDRMMEFKRRGVAIVFVSHNLQAVNDLCDKALFLRTTTLDVGAVDRVIASYVRAPGVAQVPTSRVDVEILESGVRDSAENIVTSVEPGARLSFSARIHPKTTVRDVTLGFLVYRSTDNLLVYDGNFTDSELGIAQLSAEKPVLFECSFRAHLTRGQYHIVCHVYHNPTQRFLARVCPAAVFAVREHRTYAGVADLEAEAKLL